MERNITNDKQKNMAYWDEIDDIMLRAVTEVAAMSYPGKELDEDEAIELSKFIEENVIEKLTERGFHYPFVDENY